jgi:hypothetical protein
MSAISSINIPELRFEIQNGTEILNAFQITDLHNLRWQASIYKFTPLLGKAKDQRKAIVQAAWAAHQLFS